MSNMIKSNGCVAITSPAFKKLISELNISSGDLELAIKKWLDQGNTWEENTEDTLKNYLNQYFNISSTFAVENKEKENKLLEYWNSISKGYSSSSKEASTKVYDASARIFGKENVAFYQNSKGEFVVRVAKPSYRDIEGVQVTYIPVGKTEQTYYIKGDKIYNKKGNEVFATQSVDRNKIFAKYKIKQGNAVVVTHEKNGEKRKYIVDSSGEILSVDTGNIMRWAANNGNRRDIIELANRKFASLKQNRSNNSSNSVSTKYFVTKIISGGQTGVDTIGLQVAKELGIETGGKAPKGYKRESGYDNEDIKTYGLEEITDNEQSDYTKRTGKTDPFTGRTELNVRNSDGTVYFYTSDDKLGYYATKRSAANFKKPFITNPTPEELAQWIIDNNIKTLNVAGNRGTKLSKDNNVADTIKKALEITSQDSKSISQKEASNSLKSLLKKEKELNSEQSISSSIEELVLNQIKDEKVLKFATLVLNTAKSLGIKFEKLIFESNELGEISGKFVADKKTVYYNPEALLANTILHEAIHSITSYYFEVKDRKSLPKNIQIALEEIEYCYNVLKQDFIDTHFYENGKLIKGVDVDAAFKFWIDGNDTYGYTSPKEMIAEITKPSFLEHIKDFDKRHKNTNIFEKLINAIFRIFNITKEYKSLEGTIKKAITELINNPSLELLNNYSEKNKTIKENIHKLKNSNNISYRYIPFKKICDQLESVKESQSDIAEVTLEISNNDISEGNIGIPKEAKGKFPVTKPIKNSIIIGENSLYGFISGAPAVEGTLLKVPITIVNRQWLETHTFDVVRGENGVDYISNIEKLHSTNSINNLNLEYSTEELQILKNAPRNREGQLLAPNGKVSNLTERLYAQVRTKAFKDWFGDWENDPKNASKVIDENGEPLVVYTGVPVKNLTVFSLNTKNRSSLTDILNKRIYFTKDKKIAERYAIGEYKYYTTDLVNEEQARKINTLYYSGELGLDFAPEYIGLSSKTIIDYVEEFTSSETGELASSYRPKGEVLEVFLNAKNPTIIDNKGASMMYLSIENKEKINRSDSAIITNINENPIGYIDEGITTDYLISNPNQVKSATDNIGTFDKTNDDIYDKVVQNHVETLEVLGGKEDENAKSEVKDAIQVAKRGISFKEALSTVSPVFTEEEIKQIESTLNGKNLQVMSVSRQTDPAFFSKEIIRFLEKNAQKPLTDPTRINVIELWTKHDGMPIRDILEACKKYKVAPMVSFSITGLGNSALEKGVLKYNDLLDLIGELIKEKVLDPKTTTIRIDPILAGYTNMDDIKSIIKRGKELGIKKFVTSLVQSYGYLDGTSRDRKITSGINEALSKENQTYDWEKYYGRNSNGKINFKPKLKYIDEIGLVLLELNKDPEIEIETCAFMIKGLKASACLDPLIIERVTGVDVTKKDGTYDRDTSRPECMCYGAHSDMFRFNEKKCFSSCAYCYAAHSGDNNLQYYNEDGTMKDMPLTRTKSTNQFVTKETTTTSDATVISDKFAEKEVERGANVPQESIDLINTIISDSNTNIRKHENFDLPENVEGSHTYLIWNGKDWENVDISVTQYIHGKLSYGAWGLPSGSLGNTADRFSREYYDSLMEDREADFSDIPNLSTQDKKNLKNDLDRLTEYLDDYFGGKENYIVITKEFPIAGKFSTIDEQGNPVTKTIAGTMDMLICDSEGNFYIFDMKTSRSDISFNRKYNGYSTLVFSYKSILESNYSQMKGKFKNLKLIRFDLSYPAPAGAQYSYGSTAVYSQGKTKDALMVQENGNDPIPIEESENYQPIRLHMASTSDDISTALVEAKEEAVEKMLDIEPIMHREKSVDESYTPVVTDEKDTKMSDFYNNPLLSASERDFLSKNIMYTMSFMISNLQKDPEKNRHYFMDKYTYYDFTKMSRREIIDTIGVNDFFERIRETYYNSENREDIDDIDTLLKLDLAYDNFDILCNAAYAKLITLEDTTVFERYEKVTIDDLIRDGIDESLMTDLDSEALEDSGLEYWQRGQRQISARSSLSGEIRRAFEKLEMVDAEGNPVMDPYGFNFKTYIDSGEAVNKILDWCSVATTMEDMENILKEMLPHNPWVSQIIELIKKEPFRSQFFQNFRKDFTQYSIITVEYDKNGARKYVVNVINTKGATKAMLDGMVVAYKEGALTDIIKPIHGDIEGRGIVNISKVTSLKEEINTISKNISSHFGNKKAFEESLDATIPAIVTILHSMGIDVRESVLSDAFAADSSKKNKNQTVSVQMLDSMNKILSTILDNKDKNIYSPIEKGAEGNTYSDYKKLINYMSRYIQDNIESSTYENGKMHYSFTTPSYMGKLALNLRDSMGNMEQYKKFMMENYGSYRYFKEPKTDFETGWMLPWAQKLAKSPEAREGFQHKVQLSMDKTPYNELSELGYALSLINEYFYDKNKKWAWYRIPIMANKPSSEFIRFYRHRGLHYKDTITDGFYDIMCQEILRIRTVLERAANNEPAKIGVKEKPTFDIKKDLITPELAEKIKTHTLTHSDLVKNGKLIFQNSGAEFKFLFKFNENIIANDIIGQLLIDKINGKEINEDDFYKLFKDQTAVYMEEIVASEIQNLESLGLFDTEERKGKTHFKYANNLGSSVEEIKESLTEYIWNDMFATMNIIELTVTDLAYYKNVEEFQKRYAEIHNPSLRLNVEAKDSKGNYYSANEGGKHYERTMYLADHIASSEIIPIVNEIFEEKIKTLSGTEKTHMKMMKDLILTAFKEVNVADAQGYSSPTSYRKKLGMMGKWTDEMEEAYDRIASGDYNVDDLGIVWQPLKPFVYSQIRKDSHAETLSELKVPVQNKNSEYLLLIANALMHGSKKTNKLTAIFDFMEESAYDGREMKEGKVVKGKEGKYNGRGIDTIQFISAVNSGSMGAIDINDLDDYEDVKAALKIAAYSGDNGSYDSNYVHEIPFEDYGIQQEVPAHLQQEGGQLFGSQERILIISDISDGTTFKIKEGEEMQSDALIKEYQELIAANIQESFDTLVKDLHLTGTRKEKNRAISKLLIEAIKKDQRYGADLLRSCSLSEDEFIIPLSDPIQSIRIQQLLNSIIKSRINKQKMPGGPVVQASVFGMSDDLKIVWKDKNGNKLTYEDYQKNKKGNESYQDWATRNAYSVAYFECYIPIPNAELEEAMTVTDSNGHSRLMSLEEAKAKGIINEEMLKAIGYRIPTEDKYSMAPLYIKGFLPKAAGQAVMLPKEITTLSGSDFDIDKLYIMLKSFTYTSPKNDYQNFRNRIISSRRKYLEKIGKSEEDIKADLRNFEYGNAAKAEMSLREYVNRIAKGYSFETTVEGRTKVDKKGQTIKAWYDKYIREFKENNDIETRDGRNNRIFDLQWAILTNHDTMIKMFNPGSFDVQKKTARIIDVLESSPAGKYTYEQLSKLSMKELEELSNISSNRSILLPSTQVYFHKQNMTAGKLIGIFANNNTSHSFVSMQDISLRINEGFMFDGVLIDNNSNNKLDPVKAKNGSYVSKNIAGFLAASVDAVKDPVLNKMNLNAFTANVAMLLARLGFDSDSIGLFLKQPIIVKVTREYFKKSNEGVVTANDIIDEFLPKDSNLIKGMRSNLTHTPFTKEDLAEGVALKSSESSFAMNTLLLFKELSGIAQDLNTLTFLTKFNSVTNATGPTIADTLVMESRYRKFSDGITDGTVAFSNSALDVIENSPILKAFYDTTVGPNGASKLIFEPYFPHYTEVFTEILELLEENLKGNLTSKIINKLVNDYMLYKLTLGSHPVIDGSEESRRDYIYNYVHKFKEQTKDIINNDLLNIININPSNKKCPVPTLEAKTGGYSSDALEKIKVGWSNLVLNPDTRQLGIDLFFYNVVRSGFTYSPKTFGHASTVDVKLRIPGYVQAISDITYNDQNVSAINFLYMFLRNHTEDYKLVPSLESNKEVVVTTSEDPVSKTKTIKFKFNKYYTGMDSIIVSKGDEVKFAPVIIYDNKVYMNPTSSSSTVEYIETTPLGNTNNFLEYDGNGSYAMPSVIKENSSVSRESLDESGIPEQSKKTKTLTGNEINSIIDKFWHLAKDTTKALPNFKDILLDKVVNKLGIENDEGMKKVIARKIEEKLKKYC